MPVASLMTAAVLVAATATPASAASVQRQVRAEDVACAGVRPDSEVQTTVRDSQPLAEMDIDTAHGLLARRGVEPGEDVVVAVIDSGVSPLANIDVVGRLPLTGSAPEHYHGTAVASLIAGHPTADGRLVGIAPEAEIADIQVYDEPVGEAGGGVKTRTVVAALQRVLTAVRDGVNIKVVNISLALPEDPRMQPLIEQLWEADVVVVAPTGNRPGQGDDDAARGEEFATHQPGEDAAETVWPARYEHVLAVSASMGGVVVADGDAADATTYVLENSRTDLAAPTAYAVAYSLNGGTCVLVEPATSWAAALVSGVLAMNQSLYDETAGQATMRLKHTADGRSDLTNRLVGAGEVQPVAALTRPLVMDEDGNIDRSVVVDVPRPATAPVDDPDLLAATRRNAVWWGVIGGGALLLALVLRPVLTRRQRR